MYLLDTNTLIYYFKGSGRVAERLLATSPTDVSVSTITVFELEVGLAKSRQAKKRRQQLGHFLSLVRVLPFGPDEAHASAKVRAELERSGTPIGPLDNLIAGTAVASAATLVTHNLGEFRRVRGLKVADWY